MAVPPPSNFSKIHQIPQNTLLRNTKNLLYKSVYLWDTSYMSELKEKIRQLDSLNLKTVDANDLVYEILSDMTDRIEKLEGNSPKTTRKHDVDYYMSKNYFNKVNRPVFTQDEIIRFIEKINEDRE